MEPGNEKVNEKKNYLVGVHLNDKEFAILQKYSKKVHLRPSTALKQVLFEFLDEHDNFRDIIEEELRA
ncbi:MAG: hypothetical protein QXU98_03990 [Candidatus Parvarchaeota archaeon]